MVILIVLPFLPLMLVPFGLKPRTWQFGVSRQSGHLDRVILRWKNHPMVWWEVVIMAVLLASLCGSAYDDLTPKEFRNGRRAGKGLDYWFEKREHPLADF